MPGSIVVPGFELINEADERRKPFVMVTQLSQVPNEWKKNCYHKGFHR
jgi:hypothetical protein